MSDDVRRVHHHSSRRRRRLQLVIVVHRLLDDGQLDQGIRRLLHPANRPDGSTGVARLREIAEVDGEGHSQVGAAQVQRLLPLGPRVLDHALHLHVVAVPGG